MINDLGSTEDYRYEEIKDFKDLMENALDELDRATEYFVWKAKQSPNPEMIEFFKTFSDYQEFSEFRDEDNNIEETKNNLVRSNSKVADIPTQKSNEENSLFTVKKLIGLAKNQNVSKPKKNKIVAAKQSKLQKSLVLHSTWEQYVDKLMKSKTINKEIKSFHNNFSDAIYSALTDIDHVDNLDAYSFKVFISNALEYICYCKKEASNIFIVTYMFRTFANVLDKCKIIDIQDDIDVDLEEYINENILDILDTTKNTKMMFTLLSENMDGNIYSDQIFMIGCYYLNKLLYVRTATTQEKFEIMFKNHSGSQAFFTKVDKYINIYSSKIANGVLKESYENSVYTDEASNRPYYIDKSLEKQMVILLKSFCMQGNTFMQDYMRDQTENNRTYNLVMSITDFLNVFTDHLQFPIVYQIFISCLQCMFEFIQGPNRKNQMVIIMSEFVGLSNDILMLDYKNKSKKGVIMADGTDKVKKSDLKTNSSKSIQKSKSITASTLNHLTEQVVTKPKLNFHISLAKYRILFILNHLLDGFKITDYVFYLYRRELNPDCWRKTFAYQKYYMDKYYKLDYTQDVFFNYVQENDDEQYIPCIIEIGFM